MFRSTYYEENLPKAASESTILGNCQGPKHASQTRYIKNETAAHSCFKDHIAMIMYENG